ncbi:MAG TPA: metallopeptidase family protein [Chloroflexota bacterium]|jgi:predicted Zn-dependent protease with MMP-like domain
MRQRGVRCSPWRFHRLVVQACAQLPLVVQQHLQNVAITVEDEPLDDMSGDGSPLGLYQGTPLGERGTAYSLVLPDKVTIYRRALLRACHTRRQLKAEIELTLLHEIGHHFGMEDNELPF